MLIDYINKKTGFADGDLFQTRSEVRKYFSVENMEYLFGTDSEISQEELDEMAELVIQKKWHMVITSTKVFSMRVNRSDSDEDITKKITELKLKINQFRA